MKRILVLNGINLNMFGQRDPVQYGTITPAEIDSRLEALGLELGVEVECSRRTSRAQCANASIRPHRDAVDADLINAGAWTHYSYRHPRRAGHPQRRRSSKCT